MLTEVEKVALLGRPRLGDVTKVQIRIKESKEFKVGLAMPVDYSSRVLRMDFFFPGIRGQNDATWKRIHDVGCLLLEGSVHGCFQRPGRSVKRTN